MYVRIWAVIFLLASLTLALPQDEDEEKLEVVECEVKVGKRPANVYNMPGFKAKPPLKLECKNCADAKLRESVGKGIEYILSQQNEDGSWKLVSKKQLRKDDEAKQARNFVMTALDSTNPVVMTALSCLALRAHQDLAPRRIDEAVSNGLAYVLQNAHKQKRRNYAVWTFSFTIEFLAGEYDRAFDPTLRSSIQEVAQVLVDKLLQDQHGGLTEVGKMDIPDPSKIKVPKEDEKDVRDSVQRSSKGGYFGVTPSDDDEIGKEGALIVAVAPNSPASRGGLKAGDRIIEIDGMKIQDVPHLYEVVDSLEPNSTVKVKVLRDPNYKPNRRRQRGEGEGMQMFGKVPKDGGWSYYKIGAVSFTTATAILALLEARKMGCDVPQNSIDRAVQFLLSSRLVNEKTGELGYAYHAQAKKGPIGDIRASVGRVGVCELALLQTGEHKVDRLHAALDVFIRRRGELDRVRGYPGNHFTRSFMNAAYYFLYAHYYTARATNHAKDKELAKKCASAIQEALLKIQHEEGTWTDHEAWGQLYGTSMALMALGEIKWLNPGAYKTPIDSLEPQKAEY